MNELKQILLALGLSVAGPTGIQDMSFYHEKLSTEMVTEQRLQSEIKSLEYKKMWEDVNEPENRDFAAKWLKDKKASDKLEKTKKELTLTKKKIKVLKQIIQKDSLDRLPPKIDTL